MSFSAHSDNKKRHISPTQGLEHTPTAGKMYSINFIVTVKCTVIFFKFALPWSK